MERRSFLKLFSLAAAAFAVETPTVAQIFETAQAEPEFCSATFAEIEELTRIYYLPAIVENCFQPNPIMNYLKAHRG